MKQIIERFWNEASSIMEKILKKQLEQHKNMSDEELINIIYKNKFFHQFFSYLDKYFDNPKFIQFLLKNKKMTEDDMAILQIILPSKIYYKVVDYCRKNNPELSVGSFFVIVTEEDIDFLFNSDISLIEITKCSIVSVELAEKLVNEIFRRSNGQVSKKIMESILYNMEYFGEQNDDGKQKFFAKIVNKYISIAGQRMGIDYLIVNSNKFNNNTILAILDANIDTAYFILDAFGTRGKEMIDYDSELAKKLIDKYGLDVSFFIKFENNQFFEAFPNFSEKDYLEKNGTWLDSPSILLSFLNKSHSKDLIFRAGIYAFSDEVLKFIINNYQESDILKLVDTQRGLKTFKIMEIYLLKKGHADMLTKSFAKDFYTDLNFFNDNYQYVINSKNPIHFCTPEFIVSYDKILPEIMEQLIDKKILNIEQYLCCRGENHVITEDFLKRGYYKAILKADNDLFEKYKKQIPIDELVSYIENLEENQKISDDILTFLFANRKYNLVKKILLKHENEILITDNDYSVLVELANTDFELLKMIYKFAPENMQVKLLKIKPEILYDNFYFTHEFINKISLSNIFNKNIPWDILNYYKGNKGEFILNFEKIEQFIEKCGIPFNKFIQYALGNSYNWLSDILKICDNNKIEDFIKLKNKFINNNDNIIISTDNFVMLIKNYSRYPELCNDIINQDRELTEEEKNKIEFLFNRNEVLEDNYKPTNIQEYSKFIEMFKKQYTESSNIMTIQELKEFLCKVLFNCDYEEIMKKLSNYGDTVDLRKMVFNDKNNKELEVLVRKMMVYTSMLESIVLCDDFEVLKEISVNVAKNFDFAFKCSMHFNNYDKNMRYLYEKESQIMLTNTSKIKDKSKVIDEEFTEKYGVETYDYSDKRYNLYAHVKSGVETIEELVTGIPQKNHNFICLSAIGNRNQIVYFRNLFVIFVYDNLPNDSYIMSSTSNMSSNSCISHNSTEIKNISREQRGIVESSEAKEGYNSEALCFREGLKPVGILLPGGREPTDEEIQIAKQYGLVFIKTQEDGKTIKNPIDIEMKEEQEVSREDKIEQLNQMKEQLLVTEKTPLRRIAIIADAHGTFEPTLAALEDARRQGITEIYSLGDNIGTGPNPKEVQELIDEYGVQSIKGNHELYMLDGVENFAKHLKAVGGYDEAKNNSDWTRSKLTTEQKNKIRLYPAMINLTLGGKKIILCHSIYDYNNVHELVVDTNSADTIIQGHIHFADESGNIITARGVGIGGNKPNASYLILQEKEDGGFEIIHKEIAYDSKNLAHSILESDLNKQDADKIASWTHATK